MAQGRWEVPAVQAVALVVTALISRFPEFQAMAQVAAAGAAAFRPESPVRAVAAGLEVPAEQVRTRAR